jgi:hypothetical protein
VPPAHQRRYSEFRLTEVDPALLGDAIHVCLAAFLTSGDAQLTARDISQILDRNGIAYAVST